MLGVKRGSCWAKHGVFGKYFEIVGTRHRTRDVSYWEKPCLMDHNIIIRSYLVLLGGVGACLAPGFSAGPGWPAAARRSWTSVDLLDMMAEAGPGEDPGHGADLGEGRESSRGGLSLVFLVGSIGVWLELLDGGLSSASTSSVMEDSWNRKKYYLTSKINGEENTQNKSQHCIARRHRYHTSNLMLSI